MPKEARVALSVVPVGAPAVDLAAELISASDPTEKLRSILVNARHIRVNDCGLPSWASTEGAVPRRSERESASAPPENDKASHDPTLARRAVG
jgi:hypothetical protein